MLLGPVPGRLGVISTEDPSARLSIAIVHRDRGDTHLPATWGSALDRRGQGHPRQLRRHLRPEPDPLDHELTPPGLRGSQQQEAVAVDNDPYLEPGSLDINRDLLWFRGHSSSSETASGGSWRESIPDRASGDPGTQLGLLAVAVSHSLAAGHAPAGGDPPSGQAIQLVGRNGSPRVARASASKQTNSKARPAARQADIPVGS